MILKGGQGHRVNDKGCVYVLAAELAKLKKDMDMFVCFVGV